MKQNLIKLDETRVKDIIDIRELIEDTIKNFNNNTNNSNLSLSLSDC